MQLRRVGGGGLESNYVGGFLAKRGGGSKTGNRLPGKWWIEGGRGITKQEVR